jgi:DNA-binding response OmpR family regulator
MKKELQKRILIIDDDVDLLMLLERRLEKEGYNIETAASLTEAEEILPEFTPHLVLLDINVNGEDGRQLCWKLKKTDDSFAVKVMLMSGYDYNAGRAALFGADELLSKPLHTDYLLHRMDAHLYPQAEPQINLLFPVDLLGNAVQKAS